MTPDVVTVARKELREILSNRVGSTRSKRPWLRTLIFPVLLGVALGAQASSRNHVEAGFAVFPVAMIMMGLANGLITDAIAGERERHTLETLLASPVSDQDILAGKVLAVVGYAWSIALVQLLTLGVVSAAFGHAINPGLLGIVALLGLPEGVLAAAFGVQFSLRAPTVRAAGRKAAQYSIVVNLVVSAANAFVVAGSGAARVFAGLAALVVLVIADISLFGVARVRFRRGQLLLD
jgi:ABC-2 type transport system permease protein